LLRWIDNQLKVCQQPPQVRHVCDGPHGRPDLKDPLQVPDGPITRSRAKKIKEAMQGLVQSIWAEFANLSRKTLTFKIGLKEEEPTLVHVIQATDGGSIA
jgi:hypothetical protein